MNMVLTLFVTRGNEKGQMYDVPDEGVTIGRDLTNAVCLTDLETSRMHCRINITGNSAELIDLQSSNGTFVNSQPVSTSSLKIGDHINVGQTVFVVLAPDEVSNPIAKPSIRAVEETSMLSPGPVPETAQDERFVSQMKSNLQFMYDASLATSKKEIGPMMDDILMLIFEWVSADRGCILLRDGPKKPLQPRSMQYREPNKASGKFKISRSIAKHVDENNVGVLSSDIHQSAHLRNAKSVLASGISEVLCVPIRGRDFGLGLIYIDRLDSSGAHTDSFNEDHLKLLHVIAHQAATAIENDEYYGALLEKERMLAIGETAEKLSHRIKNILQSINGGTHLVETGIEANSLDSIRQGWSIVKRNQDRMSKLVLEMLLVNNDYAPQREETNINLLISNVVDEHQVKSEPLGIKVELKHNSDQPVVSVDPSGISAAVGYVIGEAVLNSRGVEGATVTVAMVTSPEIVEIFIRSAEADIQNQDEDPQISEMFSAAKEFFPGLELSAAQKILRGHEGNLDISNEVSHEDYRIWFPTAPANSDLTQTLLKPRDAVTTWTQN